MMHFRTIIFVVMLNVLAVTSSGAADNHYATFMASYMPKNATCAHCHTIAENNQAIRQSWAASGHGDVYSFAWSAHDYKLFSGCVQCHSTTGFIAYSSGRVTTAWGSADDYTRELLACNGCHTDIESGAIRSPVPVKPYPNDARVNPSAGPSNLCAGCHSGMASGRTIKALTNLNTKFVGSHLSAASGVLYASAGYEFAGRDYRNATHFKHDRIGINNYTGYGYVTGSKGPCIACHMSSSDRHSFLPVARDANRVISDITTAVCAGCHTPPADLDAARLNSRKQRFKSALLALQGVIESKGILYKPDNVPYFFTPSHADYTAWGTADVMGAAFNLHLLWHEHGAYSHNMVYAKRLIYDSIDFMDDGLLNNSVAGAITGVATLDDAQKAVAIGYLMPGGKRP